MPSDYTPYTLGPNEVAVVFSPEGINLLIPNTEGHSDKVMAEHTLAATEAFFRSADTGMKALALAFGERAADAN